MQILFLIFMFTLGAIFGSFLCCQARRLHLRSHQKTSHVNLKAVRVNSHISTHEGRGKNRVSHQGIPNRSICLHCQKPLKWYDNLPLISWPLLRGKCRFCHQKIGLAEIISELFTALALLSLSVHFLYSHHALSDLSIFPSISPLDWCIFIVLILFALSLVFLAIYDGLYGELPTPVLTISAICAIIMIILQTGNNFSVAGFFDGTTFTPEILFTSAPFQSLLQSLASAALFGGIYLLLYLISKGRWVGDGDWILAGVIGLTLGSPWLSMIALFVANFSACLAFLPFTKIAKNPKNLKNHQIYFGPFLVFAFILVHSLSDFFISMI